MMQATFPMTADLDLIPLPVGGDFDTYPFIHPVALDAIGVVSSPANLATLTAAYEAHGWVRCDWADYSDMQNRKAMRLVLEAACAAEAAGNDDLARKLMDMHAGY